MMRPWSTIAMWSQVFSTSSSRWEERNTVRPSSTKARIRLRISRMPAGSSPFIGSSRISSAGSASRQRAMPSRWRMPSEYVLTRSSARWARPTRSRDDGIRVSASRSRAAATIFRFSRPVRWGWNFGSSTIAPTRASASRRFDGCGSPSSEISPDVGWVRPSSVRIIVVFPAPFGPRKPNATPAGNVQIDAVDGRAAAELLRQRLRLDDRFHARTVRDPSSRLSRRRRPGSTAVTAGTRPAARRCPARSRALR